MASSASAATTTRAQGYAPIADYAAIGDGRTVALIASDGAIDWLCLPDLDSPPVFGALLDANRGGRFVVAPSVPFTTTRRYVPGTNMLETTFHTEQGIARLTDALTMPHDGLFPLRELARVVEGVKGRVPFRWCMAPRFGFANGEPRLRLRGGVVFVDDRSVAIALRTWDGGTATISDGVARAEFETTTGSRSLLALSAAQQEPLVIAPRLDVEDRLEHTAAVWRDWTASRKYDGPWADAVLRSALALKLLVYAPSGAIAAAATTSLPEQLGGERNWDYRLCWLRDAAFVMNALLQLGCAPEADAFFWWLMHASQLTRPDMQVLYRLNGDASAS